MTRPDRSLEVYLNDHRAGAAAGRALARHLARANRGTPYADELASIAAEVTDDAASLDRLMAGAGVRANPIKRLVAVAGERAMRLKPTGTLPGYSPLARLLGLEELLMGVRGKALLWETLRTVYGPDDPVPGVDLAGLARRAGSQIDRLAALHARAGSELDASPAAPAPS